VFEYVEIISIIYDNHVPWIKKTIEKGDKYCDINLAYKRLKSVS
jgi:hypothetical protein